MKAKTKLTKLWSFLLSLVMLLSLLPTTAFAASYAEISVNDIILKDNYYLKSNTATTANSSSTEPSSYVAWYKNGVLTLKGYNGKGIETQGVAAGELTVKLIGSNSINNGALVSDNGGDITVTSDSSGTLSISKTTSGYNPAIGIETGLSGSYTTGNVTIKGNAKVTIDMTHNGTKGYDRAYGIYAKENITISENASVDITCATPNNTTGGGNCNGLYAQKNVSIDTTGTIKIDVTNAGKDKDNGYSYGVYYMSTATLTKVGNMEVQWKKEVSYSSHSGGAILRGASLSDTDYAINEDTTNCYASYRFGTPRTVTAGNGKLTGPGVKYPDGNGKFLAGDKVNITPATKKGRSGEEIPFKEWTSSDVMLDKSATTASNSFTVPGKDVTVTAKHSPFVGTPTFTPTGSTGTDGTLTFKTVVDLADGSEVFCLVKDGEQNDESKYISFRTDNSPSASPYEYSYETRSLPGGNQVKAGDYYVAEYLNGNYYLSEKFTVNYTAPVTTYTVSFNANGGTGTMADVTDISGEYTLPANGFTAPAGKQFKAWSVGGVEKAAGDKITVTANTTVTAVWENTPVVTYTVSFAANGGTGTMADVTGISGEYTLPANGFTAPAGKQFKAWSVGGVEKAAGDKITVTANTTVTAVWEAIEYNVTVTGGTASVGAGTPITKATMGTTVTLTANAAPSGKVFDKWEVVSGGITLADANSATTTFTMPAEAVSVKATYKNAPHTHTYNQETVKPEALKTPADCTRNAVYFKSCSCGAISTTDTFVAMNTALHHAYGSDWKYDSTNHWHECSRCHDKKNEAAHTASDWIIDTPATATTAGTKHKECTVCHRVLETQTIPSTGTIEYNITVTDGKATVGAGTPITKATMGTTVTLTANAAPSGKVFDKWVVVSGGITLADANSATTTFIMPASAVSVKATYKNAPHTPTPTPTPTHTHNLTLVAAKAATCTEGGKEAYYKCEGCGKFYEDVLGTKEITDLASWGNIAKIAHTTKLNATSLTYNGKVRTPKVIVKDETGKTLVKNTDYTVSYAKGRKYVGKYAVKITFKGKYSGTKTLYFTIKPKATSISSFTVGSKKFTVKWKKQATQTTGYQVQYSASSEFSKAKTVTVGKNTTVSKKISKLSGKKKYYVRVRTYKTVKINGKSIRIYSGWSKAKTVTTKK